MNSAEKKAKKLKNLVFDIEYIPIFECCYDEVIKEHRECFKIPIKPWPRQNKGRN